MWRLKGSKRSIYLKKTKQRRKKNEATGQEGKLVATGHDHVHVHTSMATGKWKESNKKKNLQTLLPFCSGAQLVSRSAAQPALLCLCCICSMHHDTGARLPANVRSHTCNWQSNYHIRWNYFFIAEYFFFVLRNCSSNKKNILTTKFFVSATKCEWACLMGPF